MVENVIEVVDPGDAEVRAILEQHHAFVGLHTLPEDIHALDVEGLLDRAVTVFGLRAGGALLGIGALKELGGGEGELKSMHTVAAARSRGIAGALVDHMVAVAAERGLTRLNLETGAPAAFAPAWSVYASRGFVPCGPFASYAPSQNSRFMTRAMSL